MDTVVIPRRFNGPPDSANGGYTAGILGRVLPGVSEVTLRTPPPLETPLEVRLEGSDALLVGPDGVVVALAHPASVDDVEPLVRPTPEAAERAGLRHPGRGLRHTLSDCVVCGPDRADGFRLSTGPLEDTPEVGAAVFLPDPALADPDGNLPPEILWAALDCPGFTPAMWQRYLSLGTLTLLGRLTASLEAKVPAGKPLVAVGWPLATDGRKHRTASALLTEGGEVVARAKATWVELRRPTAS